MKNLVIQKVQLIKLTSKKKKKKGCAQRKKVKLVSKKLNQTPKPKLPSSKMKKSAPTQNQQNGNDRLRDSNGRFLAKPKSISHKTNGLKTKPVNFTIIMKVTVG